MQTATAALPARAANPSPDLPAAIDLAPEISRVLQDLEHGEITIKVHDGEVVLIERVSRWRPHRFKLPAASSRRS